MPQVIRLNDPTDHGGQVIEVSASSFIIQGHPVARVGDLCSCPLPGHDRCTIVEGDADFTIDDIPVAFAGHKTSCGATLIAIIEDFSTD